MLWPSVTLTEVFRTKFAKLRLRPTSVRRPFVPPRTPSVGVYGWVSVSARGETRGPICTRWVKFVVAWSMALVRGKTCLRFHTTHRTLITNRHLDAGEDYHTLPVTVTQAE